jgi:hypothetical protein
MSKFLRGRDSKILRIVILLGIIAFVLFKITFHASASTFPTTTIIDNFNRANESPLATASSGATWSSSDIFANGNKDALVSNQGTSASVGYGTQYISSANYGPDSEAYITVKGLNAASTDSIALYSRLTSEGTVNAKGYEIEIQANQLMVMRVHDTNTFPVLATIAQTVSVNDSVGFAIKGTSSPVSIEVWYKASAGSWTLLQTVSDNFSISPPASNTPYLGAGKIGLEFRLTTAIGDDFGGGTVVSNTAPAAPTLSSPANAATGVALAPQFQLSTTDADNDYLQYEVQICSTSNCSSVVQTACQNSSLPNSCTGSQTGWSGQDQQTSTAYTGNSTLASSTMATYTYQSPPLSANTQYWWRAYAIDPGGSNTASSVSSIQTFTTNAPPAAPTLTLPAASATNVPTVPIFQLSSSDTDNDYLKYKIFLYQSDCSTLVATYDQTSLQAGWSGQDQQSSTAYLGSATLSASTVATYTFSSLPLLANTTYCWKAQAIDPGGTNTLSSASSGQTFTTAATDAFIRSGTTIQSGTTIH